jgi:uncharacterized protein YceH (UPF0502 family)
VNFLLTEVEVRVLGSLMEKDATTPDYYPLSINALVNACNQKSNRDPFMTLTEDAVRQALESLKEKKLAGPVNSADSRVTKYEHRMQEVFNFSRGENAVLCVLMLRGAQTPGELRGRTERIHPFEDLDEVQGALQKLMQRDQPLVQVLQRQPGTKESRYVHLFRGLVEPFVMPEPNATPRAVRMDNAERLEKLEETVAGLQQEMEELKLHFAGFRKQFE